MTIQRLCSQIFLPKNVRRNQIVNNLTKDYEIDQNFNLFKKQFKNEAYNKGFSLKNPFATSYIRESLYYYRNSIVNLKLANVTFDKDKPLAIEKNNKNIKLFEESFKKVLTKMCSNLCL